MNWLTRVIIRARMVAFYRSEAHANRRLMENATTISGLIEHTRRYNVCAFRFNALKHFWCARMLLIEECRFCRGSGTLPEKFTAFGNRLPPWPCPCEGKSLLPWK